MLEGLLLAQSAHDTQVCSDWYPEVVRFGKNVREAGRGEAGHLCAAAE